MSRIAVVTDSTANLTEDLVADLEISLIPLNVHWGEDTFLDGVTLDAPSFYQRLQTRKDFPMTSQPSVGDFIRFFQDVAERFQTDTIFGVFISAALSGTLSSALQARNELPDLHIELVDSRSVSMGLGFQALTAARAAQSGADLAEVLSQVARVRASTEVFIALDTLEYLHRGGRIGGAARLVGTMLNFKPLLTVEDGKIASLGKERSRRKSLQNLVDLAEVRLAGRPPAELALMHAEADEDVDYLLELLRERLDLRRVHRGLLTPVLGTHGGPNAIGMVFYPQNGTR